MRLQDCNLDVDLAVSAPFIRTEPESTWVQARQAGLLPDSVFDLYQLAEYLSFGSAPPFLADNDNILFSYFGIVLESVRDSLVEANEHRRLFDDAVTSTYDLGKKVRGEPWDPDAPVRANREFRYFLLTEQAVLDAIADLTAMLLTGLIPELRVGRAQFSRIEKWLGRPLTGASLIVTPHEHFLRELHGRLRPFVYPDPPERDWLPLMRLYRNKGAHLGSSIFRKVGLHDDAGRFYIFFPRQWPYIWERHLKPLGQSFKGPGLSELFQDTLIHQDAVSYVEGLQKKVTALVDAMAAVLALAYKQLGQLPFNQAALAELEGSSERYVFEHFS